MARSSPTFTVIDARHVSAGPTRMALLIFSILLS
jgi:hypothetical protein